MDAHLEAYLTHESATMSPERFAAFAAARGALVRLVHGGGGTEPERTWVRILNVDGIHGYDIDVTTREPLVWQMDGGHPVAGTFATLRVEHPR